MYKSSLIAAAIVFACSVFASDTFESWVEFDAYARDSFLRQANEQCFPPLDYPFRFNIGGVYPFNAETMSDLTNAAPAQLTMGVPSWRVDIRETNDVSRIFVIATNDVVLYTTAVPEYDPEAWVREHYGDPPEWLEAEELVVWYRERLRERLELSFTLIPSEWEETYLENCDIASTNSAAISDAPVTPQDPNSIAFAKLSPNAENSIFSFHLYSPDTYPIDIFGREHINTGSWTYRGTVGAYKSLPRQVRSLRSILHATASTVPRFVVSFLQIHLG